MLQFYGSIIFLGIGFILISFIWVAYDKKKFYDNEKRLDNKTSELIEIIKDAEEMVEEVNKFSDYIVTTIDSKNKEVFDNLKNVEDKAEDILKKVNEGISSIKEKHDEFSKDISVAVGSELKMAVGGNDLIIENILNANQEHYFNNKTNDNKVIPINSRHKEVIKLAKEGLSDVEIAKVLNIGKGEIELILGVSR